MKTRFILLTGFILLFFIGTVSARDRVEKRTIEKRFKTTGETHLQIDNKYGFLVIQEWDKDEVEFAIEIVCRGKNQKTAEEMLKRTSVKLEQSDDKIFATTNFATSPSESSKGSSTTVNYLINVPTSTYLHLKNKYGNIQLDYVSKPIEIELEHGNIYAHRLEGDNNKISINYGVIQVLKSGSMELNMKRGEARIDQLPDLKLTGYYTSLFSNIINNLQVTSTKYSQLKLGRVNTVNFGFSTLWTSIDIRQLEQKFEGARLQYCTVSIDTISPNFSSIDIDAMHSKVTLGINQKHNTKIDLSAPYGDIVLNGLKINHAARSHNSQNPYPLQTTGYIGRTSNPRAKIKISTSYATITFKNKVTD
ncbi:hypothetical protein [Gabonibacter massiliensis]|uniref:hypothetical protein n=1 Tax=Gabonibacter massiliensis TaxID=1720195 RepID=UPI00073E5604|nr:hypothetical protein [Gabonibacter massiliensis]